MDITVEDSGTGSEVVKSPSIIGVYDDLGSSEVVSSPTPIAVGDSVIGSEAVSSAFLIIVTDLGVGAEIISLLANIPVPDSGIGSEIVPSTVTDSGVVAEIISILANIPVVESGIGTEVISSPSTITIIDLGTATEIIPLLSSTPIIDAGVISDFLSVTKLIPGALPPKIIVKNTEVIPNEPVTIFAQVQKYYLHHYDPAIPTTVSLSVFKADGVAVVKNQAMLLRSPLEDIFSYTITSPGIPAPCLMSFHSQNPEAFEVATLLVKEPRKLPESNSIFLTREEKTLCEVKPRSKTIISIDLTEVLKETYMSFMLYKRDTILSDYTVLREHKIHTPYPTSTKEIEIEPEYYEVKLRGKIIKGESTEIPFNITE